MKILKKGTENLWWVGIPLHCRTCGQIVECEQNDPEIGKSLFLPNMISPLGQRVLKGAIVMVCKNCREENILSPSVLIRMELENKEKLSSQSEKPSDE